MPQACGHVERFALFARSDRDHVDFDVLLAQAFGHPHGVGILDVLVGDQHDVRDFGPIGEEPAGLGQIARADLNVVAPFG